MGGGRFETRNYNIVSREKDKKKATNAYRSSELWYMDEESIEDLVQELHALRVREIQISERLQAAISEQHRTAVEKEDPAPSEINAIPDPANGIVIGDRIEILNKIKKPANWPNSTPWVEKNHKTAATVIDIVVITPLNTQIHFVTDAGLTAWRAPNNVTILRR